MRATLLSILALTVIAALPRAAMAAEPVVTDLRIEAPDRVTVGDRVRYVIEVEADAGTTVFLAPRALPDALSLAKTPTMTSRPAATEGRIVVTLALEVAPFAPGELIVPPLRLRYRGPDAAAGEIETPASQLRVASVLPAQGEATLRDLKAQAEIGDAPAAIVLPVLIGAGAALAVVLALLAGRQRRSRAKAATALPTTAAAVKNLGPEDSARRVLDRAGSDFQRERDFGAYYSAIAVTVRAYLTQRFGFPAFALTTGEMQEQMVAQGMDRWQARLVGGLLSQCDAVVFASYEPALERADADLTAAYEIVEMSRTKTGDLVEATR